MIIAHIEQYIALMIQSVMRACLHRHIANANYGVGDIDFDCLFTAIIEFSKHNRVIEPLFTREMVSCFESLCLKEGVSGDDRMQVLSDILFRVYVYEEALLGATTSDGDGYSILWRNVPCTGQPFRIVDGTGLSIEQQVFRLGGTVVNSVNFLVPKIAGVISGKGKKVALRSGGDNQVHPIVVDGKILVPWEVGAQGVDPVVYWIEVSRDRIPPEELFRIERERLRKTRTQHQADERG